MATGAYSADVLLRCDGSHAQGLGHVMRCLALARVLTQRHHLKVAFAGRYDNAARAILTEAEVEMVPWPDGQREAVWLSRHLARTGAQALLLDIRTDLSRESVSQLGSLACIITVDDIGPRRLAADFAVLPPTSAVQALAWTEFAGEALIGWAWTILASAPLPHVPRRDDQRPRILVSMGGADPLGLTRRLATALRPLADVVSPTFVVGPAFTMPLLQAREIQALWPADRIALSPKDLGAVAAVADLALVAYGVTAQELAAAGVPSLYVGISDDHVRSAECLAATGAGQSLGRHDLLTDADLCEAVAVLARDEERRARMSAAGRATIDGGGAARLAERIAAFVRPRLI